MNVQAECRNPDCDNYLKKKSVAVGLLTGHGAGTDRIKCPLCDELMVTTESVNVSAVRRRTGRGKSSGRTKTRS
jgi:hypothetical protein